MAQIAKSTFEVYGVRRAGEGKVAVELMPTDGLSGHTTITVDSAKKPQIDDVIEATYTVQPASE